VQLLNRTPLVGAAWYPRRLRLPTGCYPQKACEFIYLTPASPLIFCAGTAYAGRIVVYNNVLLT
jgi:hypothetical protein